MERQIEPQRKLISVFRIQLRWGDYDANAHVNNVAYFTFMEAARIDWFKRIGMQTTAEGEGPVVVQTSCNYRKAVPYADALDVRVYVGAPGRTSFPTYYEIVSAEDANLTYADGQAIMVWTDRGSGQSRPVPDALRALLA
ncbi:MAG: acyl-CoA thioesterase [Burkholderiales bacterium]